VKDGLSLLSLLIDKHDYGVIRSLIGGPDEREVRGWTVEELQGLNLHERGLGGSPASMRQITAPRADPRVCRAR
jgi:hypothetical protein